MRFVIAVVIAVFASTVLPALARDLSAVASANGEPFRRAIAGGDACEQLTSLAIANATISVARVVEGALPADIAVGESRAARALSPFCRVAATLRPSADSDIKIEVWLPVAGWNGKYEAVGNGAFNGMLQATVYDMLEDIRFTGMLRSPLINTAGSSAPTAAG